MLRLPSLLPSLLSLLWLAAAATAGEIQTNALPYRAVSPTTTVATTSSSTATAAGTTHTIAVGGTGNTFEPNNITASVGDTIEYNFYPGGHSVVRSDFRFPCIPYEYSGVNRVGFFSGFQTPNVYSANGPKFRVRVNDSAPIFYYCSAPGSCVKEHMIGVINPNATWTLAVQEEFAANTTVQLSPGDPLPSETAGNSTGSSSSSSSSSSSADANHSRSHNGLNAAAIAGITLGAIALLVLVCVAFFLCGRSHYGWPQRSRRRGSQAGDGTSHADQGGGGGPGPTATASPGGFSSLTGTVASASTTPKFDASRPDMMDMSPYLAAQPSGHAQGGGGGGLYAVPGPYGMTHSTNPLAMFPAPPGYGHHHLHHVQPSPYGYVNSMMPLQSHPTGDSPYQLLPLVPAPPAELPAGSPMSRLRTSPLSPAMKESPTINETVWRQGGGGGGGGGRPSQETANMI